MQQSLIMSNNLSAYQLNEFGPIVLALAVVLAVGGVGLASIMVCGWGHVKSVGIDWSHKSVAITCK